MPILQVQNISKAFPGVVALDGVSLSLEPGEVHALLGENGAGKSTLLKILSGAQGQDTGEITFRGKKLPHQSPLNRQNEGIVTIYQEFNLLPSMSIADNIFIGREPLRGMFIDRGRMVREARLLLEQLHLRINPNVEVRDISVAEQQMVEIAKALSISADLIIMDEPTAALSEREVSELHGLIGKLKEKGVAIIYVTHRLGEVFEICDRYTVLRDGCMAGSGAVADVSLDDIIRMMVGRNVDHLPATPSMRSETPVLEIRGFPATGRNQRAGDNNQTLSLFVRPGEILGIAGLVGAGRTELARAIFGADLAKHGELFIDGKRVRLRSPQDAIRGGVALVPEDRKQQALFLTHSVKNNYALPNLAAFSRLGIFVSEREEERSLQSFKTLLKIRMPSSDVAIGTLSGGNQQKVILARCMAQKPKVLIVDEPTRGIDVGSKAEVHHLLADLARDGVAIIVISSELPEIMAVSHRIITMREGRFTGELSAAEATEERLMTMMAVAVDRDQEDPNKMRATA